MKHLFTTSLGRLRLLGWLEGLSLLILLFIAVPARHLFGYAKLVQFMGPLHGLFFLLYLLNAVRVAIEQGWEERVRWKVWLACLLPFGTFYVDRTLLRHLKPLD